jgi:hypothetical protein
MDDENCIWFHQTDGVRHRLIDFYKNSGEGLPHYISVIRDKQMRLLFNYGKHYGPHDLAVREWTSQAAKPRFEIAKEMGLTFIVVPKIDDKARRARGYPSTPQRGQHSWRNGARHSASPPARSPSTSCHKQAAERRRAKAVGVPKRNRSDGQHAASSDQEGLGDVPVPLQGQRRRARRAAIRIRLERLHGRLDWTGAKDLLEPARRPWEHDKWSTMRKSVRQSNACVRDFSSTPIDDHLFKKRPTVPSPHGLRRGNRRDAEAGSSTPRH